MHQRVVAVVLGGLLTATGCAATTASSTHDQGATRTDAPRGPAVPSSASATPSSVPAAMRPGPSLPDLPRLPAAPPAAPVSEGDYLLAPRDQVTVQVYGQDDLTRTVRLDQDGNIVLPFVGTVAVGGLT